MDEVKTEFDKYADMSATDQAINGRVMTINKSTIATLIAACATIEKQQLVKVPLAKLAVQDLAKNLSIMFGHLQANGADQVFCRVGQSAKVTHDNYYEYVIVNRITGLTKTKAMFRALNYCQEQSDSKAVIKLMTEHEGDDAFEFVFRITQDYY